jgi:hypothetical protein
MAVSMMRPFGEVPPHFAAAAVQRVVEPVLDGAG